MMLMHCKRKLLLAGIVVYEIVRFDIVSYCFVMTNALIDNYLCLPKTSSVLTEKNIRNY